MDDKSDKVFDVSKPHKVAPDATSRPIIVGHHPEMPDPMVREHAPKTHHPEPSPGHSINIEVPSVESSLSANEAPAGEVPTTVPEGESFAEDKLQDSPPAAEVVQPSHTGKPSPVPQSQDWHPDNELPIPAPAGAHGIRGQRKKTPFIVLAAAVALVAVYLLIDSGTIAGGVNLPFHIFKQDKSTTDTSEPVSVTPQQSQASTSGFTAYSIKDTNISFSYPTAWGTPSLTTDPGYAKRGGTNQPAGTYGYLVSFAANKDVQIAITASQYLPAARTALYYDFLRWCTGTADGKLYKQVLKFSTADGIDTPATVVCDQGPLADAAKFDDSTIIQLGAKNPDGSSLGDLYTKNLTDSGLPVLRVKDAAASNSENIKKLLAGVKG